MVGLASVLLLFHVANGFPFISFIASAVANSNFLPSSLEFLECRFRECCSEALHFDANTYFRHLNEDLHGQHIATERLYYHVKAHLEDPSPRRSLALSLHGFTGVGKNYATSILASNMFKRGEKSRFYHFFDATVDFLFKDSVDLYKAKVLDLIANGVRSCGRSMFVFDEVHKMPAGILDAIVPLLGYAESINGVDYRKAIFVFMGNSGASVINEFVYRVLNSGKKRTSIQYGDLRRALAASIYNEKGAFEYSDLIKQHAITAVIPFLPLQEIHVRQCIGDAARRMAVEVNEEMEEFVLNELDWEPEGSRFFSTSGCKLVYDKVGFYLQQNVFGIAKGAVMQPSEHGEL